MGVEAHPDDTYIDKGWQYVAESCKNRPVIYFGPKFKNGEMFGLPEGSFVRWVDKGDDEKLEAVEERAPDYNIGVVGLDQQFGVGIDIRFQ